MFIPPRMNQPLFFIEADCPARIIKQFGYFLDRKPPVFSHRSPRFDCIMKGRRKAPQCRNLLMISATTRNPAKSRRFRQPDQIEKIEEAERPFTAEVGIKEKQAVGTKNRQLHRDKSPADLLCPFKIEKG